MWMIRHIETESGAHLDDFDDTRTAVLHWSNEHGWCSKDCADVWPTDMKPIVGLPFQGEWVKADGRTDRINREMHLDELDSYEDGPIDGYDY